MALMKKGPNQWLIRIYKGKLNGESQYHCEYFKGTKADAEIEEARLKGEFGTMQSSGGKDPTVGEYMDRWLADYIKPFCAPATYKLYSSFIDKRIKPEIGKLKLKNLNASHVQRMFRKMVTERLDEKNKPVSASTINACNRVLKAALNQAIREGLIKENPCILAKVPAADRYEPSIVEGDQVTRLLKAAQKSFYYELIETALMTGLRLGELLALTWDDVDLGAGVITVNKALKGHGVNASVSKPKTSSGYRTVLLPKHTVMALEKLKQKQAKLASDPLGNYIDKGIVFSNRYGDYADGHNITKRTMKSICQKAGLPPMRFHDLRHSHGSLLAANSLSARTISDRLGHSDASFTMRRYTHRTTLAQMAVVNVLDAIQFEE